jgi:hypothetical protein
MLQEIVNDLQSVLPQKTVIEATAILDARVFAGELTSYEVVSTDNNYMVVNVVLIDPEQPVEEGEEPGETQQIGFVIMS